MTTQGHINNTALNVSAILSPPGCLVLPYLEYLPWDNPSNIISAQVEDAIKRWKDAVLYPILFLIGIPTNVINMAVFRKQGLKERISVCLFALSLADFMFLFQMFILRMENLDINRKERYGVIMVFLINHNLTGFYACTWVSQVISAIIASERCFCVLWPLRSHTILRTSTTTVIIIIVNVVLVGLYFFMIFRYRIDCIYDPKRGVTFLSGIKGEIYLAHQKLIEFLGAFVYGLGIPIVTTVVVVMTTIVTAIKLREAAAWRSGTSSISDAERGSGLTSREIALTKMLVCNSVLFIVCLLPNVVNSLATLWLPEMITGGKQHNLYLVGIWAVDIFCVINSTFNFFIYYSVGSRYRHTFWQLMRRGRNITKEKTVASTEIPS